MPRARWLITPVVAALCILQSAPALAAADGSLDVVDVAGRRVDLVMAFAAPGDISPDASSTASIEIGGTVIPAESRLVVSQGDGPNTAILVLDASGSMKGERIGAAVKAATSFVGALPPSVNLGLVTFSDQAKVQVAPTTDHSSVLAAIEAVRPDGDTSLYDAVAAALESVPAGSRPRIVVLSDGEDTASTRSLASVAEEAKSAGVPIDVVALQPTADQLTALKALAGASGGTLQTATASADLLKAFLEASRTFGAKAYLTATLPDGVDGQAQQVTATLDVAGLEFEQQAKLPDNASLAATSVGDTSPASSSSDPSSQGAAGGGSSRLPMLLGLLVFACILILGAVFVRSQSAARAGDRVNQVLRYRSASHPSSVAKDAASSRVQGLNDVLARSKRYRKTEQLLAAAAVDLTSGGWLLVRVTVTVLLIVIIGVFLGSLVFGVVLGGLLGWLGTMAWMNSRKAARQRMFADDLPDFLMLLASGLRAGLSFNHALESAASEGKGEVGRQMRRTLRQVQVGMALDTALMGCADRMDNDDLRWTVTALSIQQEVGGNLSTILDAAARTIRARHELRREVRTLSAEGRLSAYILVGLPIVVFCFLAIFRPEYISKLWLDPLGILMLSGLIIAMFAGWMWMRSVVRINV